MGIVINRAHSFLRKILPNSAGQFAKLRCSPQQNRPNSARHSLPFMSKLSCMLFRNLVIEGWHCAELCYQHKKQFFLIFKSATKLMRHE